MLVKSDLSVKDEVDVVHCSVAFTIHILIIIDFEQEGVLNQVLEGIDAHILEDGMLESDGVH